MTVYLIELFRAVWISVPVLIVMTGLACMNGLVMYAVYANCDPLTAGEIQRNGQVLLYYVTDKLHHLKGMPGFISACIFAGSLRYSINKQSSIGAKRGSEILFKHFGMSAF